MGQPPGEPRLATPEVSWASPFTTNSSVELRPRLWSHGDNTEHKSVVPTPWTCYIPGQRFSIRAMVSPRPTPPWTLAMSGHVSACSSSGWGSYWHLVGRGLGCGSTSYNAQDGPTTKNDQPQVSGVPGGGALL